MNNRAVSIKDVARHAEVAVGTVSNVLNYPDRVAPAKRERVLASIQELGFVRNDAARQLRAGQSRTIGLVVLDAGNPFFTSVARAAEDAAAEQGGAVVLGNSGHDAARESRYIDLFEEQRVMGLLISPVGDISERIGALRARGVVTVLVDRPSDSELHGSVAVDDVAGGYMAVQHLLETGRRRLAFVGGPVTIRQVADRLEGARQAAAEVPGASLEVLTAMGMTILDGRAVGSELVERPREELPDGVFAANDLLALGILQSVSLIHRLKVPEDIALIGYDDIDYASSAVVPLSSIRQPTELIGRTAVELLHDALKDPALAHRHIQFKPELIVRRSTAGNAAAPAADPAAAPAADPAAAPAADPAAAPAADPAAPPASGF